MSGIRTRRCPAVGLCVQPLQHKWADKGVAPDNVVASQATNGAVDPTRPLCSYPQEAQWKGTGSTDDAANFYLRSSEDVAGPKRRRYLLDPPQFSRTGPSSEPHTDDYCGAVATRIPFKS
jgi:hypothetical protein